MPADFLDTLGGGVKSAWVLRLELIKSFSKAHEQRKPVFLTGQSLGGDC